MKKFTLITLLVFATGLFTFALACSTPESLAANVLSNGEVELSWTAVSGASAYRLEIEAEEGANYEIELTVNSNLYLATNLSTGALYKFKVRSLCGGDKSNWSDEFFFTLTSGGNGGNGGGAPTGSCGIPLGLMASDITGTAALLSWNSVPGAGRYEVEVEDDENTPAFAFEAIVMDTFIMVLGLSPDGQYQFKVKAKCSDNNSDYSPWLFFGTGTGSGGNGGGNPTGNCDVPTGLTVSDVTPTSALLSWDAVPGAGRYEVEVEDDENTPAFQFEAITMGTAIMVIGLSPGGQYQFKVKTKCSGNNSDYSPWSFFTTPMNAQAPLSIPENAATIAPQREAQPLAFRLYPNPVRPNSNVVLDFEFLPQPAEVSIRLIDLQGRTQWSQQLESFEGGASVGMPVGALPAGLYQVVVQSGGKVQSQRLAVNGR